MPTKPTIPARATARRASAERRALGEGWAQRPMMLALYRRAEAQLRRRPKMAQPDATPSTHGVDSLRMLHELQVHQVELEMQNEELRIARDRMETSLERYSDLYDFAPVGYMTLDPDGVIREVNLAGSALLRTVRESLVNQRFGAFVSPDDRPAFTAFLKQLFRSGAKEECNVRLLLKGGHPVDVRMRANASGSGQTCRVAMTDITDQKLAEEKLRVSEVRYRRLFEAAHDGVLLLDPVTRHITDANPFMTQLLGYSHDQLVGKELYEIGLLKDEAASQEMFRKLKQEHQVRYEDLPLESKAGRHQEVEVVANLYQENGHSVIQCNIRDITQRKQAEELLRRNEALFSALIEQAPYGVYVVDAGLRLQQVNRKARPVFTKIRPLLGRGLSEVLRILWPRRLADEIVTLFRHTLKTGRPYQSPEFAARRRDIGVQEVYEWRIQRVTMPDGDYAVVTFFNDITERRRAEERQRRIDVLAASNRKLETEIVRRKAVEQSLMQSERHQAFLLKQSRQMQEQLRRLSRQILTVQEAERKEISRELHDVIAQTLTGINVRLANLKKGASLDIKGLDRNIAHTQQMVEQSMEIVHRFARELRPAMLDDLGLIPALHSYMKSFMTRTGIRTRLTAFAEVEQLDGNKRTALYRVAQEALTNVARHARASRVEISIHKEMNCVCMKVKDDGISFRVERPLHAHVGKRLGLLGMRERVEMVGGEFNVESTAGKGTTIIARIPLGKARTQGGGGERSRH